MNNEKAQRPLKKILAITLSLLIAAAILLAGWWLATPYQALAEVSTAFLSDSVVKVEHDDWLVFDPRNGPVDTGLILYPGGRVEPQAYAPTARSISEKGVLVVIVPMPLNLAVIAPNSAQQVIDHFARVDHWAIGGHSLGGSMAARFAYKNPGAIEGLVLWASFPAQSDDLSGFPLAVTSIYGSEDLLATPREVLASEGLLPASSRFVAIEGGNHSQFGWYGPQSGDGQAKISRAAQQQIIIEATMKLLQQLSDGLTNGREHLTFYLDPFSAKASLPAAFEVGHVR